MTDIIGSAIDGIVDTLDKNEIFVKWPIILALVLFLTEAVLWYVIISSPLSTSWSTLHYLTLIGIVELIIAAAFLFVVIRHIVHRRYKSALSFVLCIILILVFVEPEILSIVDENQNAEYHQGYPHDLAYFIKFTLHEKQYLDEIKNIQPDEKGYRYKSFVWAGVQGEGTELVYDESDALGSSAPPKTLGWWRKTWQIKIPKENEESANANAAEEVCPYHAYEIKVHFYVVRSICGFNL